MGFLDDTATAIEAPSPEVKAELIALFRDNKSFIINAIPTYYPHSELQFEDQAQRDAMLWDKFDEMCEALETDSYDAYSYRLPRFHTLEGIGIFEISNFVSLMVDLYDGAPHIAAVIVELCRPDMKKTDRLLHCYEYLFQRIVLAALGDYGEAISQKGHFVHLWNTINQAKSSDAPASVGEQGADRGVEPDAPDLTPRQRQVLELLVTGCTNKEIAAKLGIQLNTVKNHVARLYAIYGVNNRTELCARVLV